MKKNNLIVNTITLLCLITGLILFSCQKKETPKPTPAPCNYIQWTGANNCDNSGYYSVSNTRCCPVGYPFSFDGTTQCYASCEAASSNANGATIYRYNDGAGGGTTGGTTTGGTTTGGTTTGGTTGGVSTGQLMIYNSWQTPCTAGAGNSISVYVDGNAVGGLNAYFSSSPSCGAVGAITLTKNPGTYNVTGSCGNNHWAHSITVYAGQCSKLNLTQ